MLFLGFFLQEFALHGPSFAEFQKTRAGGPLGKVDIAGLQGHFKRRGLQQNVVLGWHLKEILVKT